MQRKRSAELIERAAHSIPGGVNSPVRAFKGVGGTPVFFASGDGAHLTSVRVGERQVFPNPRRPLAAQFAQAYPRLRVTAAFDLGLDDAAGDGRLAVERHVLFLC